MPPTFQLRTPFGIDEQHERFFDICDDLHKAAEGQMSVRCRDGAYGHPDRAITQAVDDLTVYASNHFAWESDVMCRVASALSGTPHEDAFHHHVVMHAREHASMSAYLTIYRKQFTEHAVSALSAYVFARHWLVSHIGGVDRELSYWTRVADGLPAR